MSHNRSTQQCPICGATQPLKARRCPICGAALRGKPTPPVPVAPVQSSKGRTGSGVFPRYDPAQGDDDLYAGDLRGQGWRMLVIVGGALLLIAGVGIGVLVSRALLGDGSGKDGPTAQVEPIGTQPPTVPPTATPRSNEGSPLFATMTPVSQPPLLNLATVTPMPPTATITPTPGPCFQTAGAGDTVYGMALRCGHRDMAVVDLILELNGLQSAEQLQEGQTLEIPWPTPTPGGEMTAAPMSDAGTGGGTGPEAAAPTVPVNAFGTPDALAAYQDIEPTLRPGMAWHVVQAGETIISVAVLYDTNVETLSQINPEVPFLQCDYSFPGGGPNCSVMLYEGQRLRVPVPLPTPTYTPSPVGTLTPTPTATATFNAPYPILPNDGAHFTADRIVTLRWGGTGVLGLDERYVVRVRDLDGGESYSALVRDTQYVLPGGWQPADGERHTLEWTVGVGRVDAQNNLLAEDHSTTPRRFTWDSR